MTSTQNEGDGLLMRFSKSLSSIVNHKHSEGFSELLGLQLEIAYNLSSQCVHGRLNSRTLDTETLDLRDEPNYDPNLMDIGFSFLMFSGALLILDRYLNAYEYCSDQSRQKESEDIFHLSLKRVSKTDA